MAAQNSDNLRERVRDANDIVDVIGSYIPLKRAGLNFVALCPFHREKSPSFNVNPQKQIFHCFGCHKGGDVFTFVQHYEGVSFIDSLKRLAERAGIPFEIEQDTQASVARDLKDRLLKIHEEVTRIWHKELLESEAGKPALDYLTRRGLTLEAIQTFRIGYSRESWDHLTGWAKARNYPIEWMIQSGLITSKEPDKGAEARWYDRFRNRVMFPICDDQGRVVAFSGRTLDPEAKGGKYVNSPETPLFHKRKILFGLDKSKRAMLDNGSALVCEGQLDMIALYMAGVRHVVAPQGTALTDDHARILKRYVKEVILCFDADNAGQKATVRSAEELLAEDLRIKVVEIPKPHDPDSYIREHGAEGFNKLMKRAVGIFDFQIEKLTELYDPKGEEGRVAIVEGMIPLLTKTRNQVLVESVSQKVAHTLGLAPGTIFDETQRLLRRARRRPWRESHPNQTESESEQQPPAPKNRSKFSNAGKPPDREFWFLKLLLNYDEELEWVLEIFESEWITHPVVRAAVESVIHAHLEGTWQGGGALLGSIDEPNVEELLASALVDSKEIPNMERQMPDVLTYLRNQWLTQQIREAGQQMDDPDMDPAQLLIIMKRRQDLERMKRQAIKLPEMD
jgi:DNA primase